MSGLIALANPRRIKASHRRRRKCASGPSVQRYYDPTIGRNLSVDPVTAYDTGDYRFFNRYAYANNNPYRFTDPDGRQSKAAGKQVGRWIRALWDNDGDFKKAQAQVERQNNVDLKMAGHIVDLTRVGIVKDAVEIGVKAANGQDANGQAAGALSGEAAAQVTERVLDGKIGKNAAEAVGAVVGKAVGDTVEPAVDRVSPKKPEPPPPPPPPPKPDPERLRN